MWLGVVLHGLAQLRAGGASAEDLATTILMSNDLLNGREGAGDAAVRQPAAQGGSYGARAGEMGVTRAAAQSRRDTLLKKDLRLMGPWAALSASRSSSRPLDRCVGRGCGRHR